MKKIPIVFALLLGACQASGSAPENLAPENSLAAAARGAVIYQDLCASCHGSDMDGGLAPSLFDDDWVHGAKDADIMAAISAGIADAGMPGFGDSLSDDAQVDLLAYIRSGAVMTTTAAIDTVPTVTGQVQSGDWVTGLDEPWGFVFTADGDAIVTEKKGALRLIQNGALLDSAVVGTPEVFSSGQGGLLDVALDPDYAQNGWVYLAFSHPKEPGSSLAMTKIVRGKISDGRWTEEQTVFQAKPEHYISARVHFGGRITFDEIGRLYFSIGDRGTKEQAQDVTVPNGKVHRVNRDGSIPEDNPFVDTDGAYPSIISYGNRNPQGLIIHPESGVLWETEHGPKGGDELNVITPGVNYGWPVISYGRNYNGTELTPFTAKPGMAQPVSQWTPSIAVCGLDVYTGDLFPEWKGRLLAGSLRNETVRLIEIDGDKYVSEATLIKDEGRVRDVTTGPDGAIYVALPNKIIRITPQN